MYNVRTCYDDEGRPHLTTVSFSLSYLDWYELKNTEAWKAIDSFLAELESTNGRVTKEG